MGLGLGNFVSLPTVGFPFALLCCGSNNQRLLEQKWEVPLQQGGVGEEEGP